MLGDPVALWVCDVCVFGMYIRLERNTLKRGRDRRARSMWHLCLVAWLKI